MLRSMPQSWARRLEAAEAAREAAEKQAAALHEQAQGLRTAAQPVQATQSTRRRSTIDQSARPRPAAAGAPGQAQRAGEPDQALRAQLVKLQAKLTATEAERGLAGAMPGQVCALCYASLALEPVKSALNQGMFA